MDRPIRRLRPVVALSVGLALSFGALGAATPTVRASVEPPTTTTSDAAHGAPAAWTGGINLYRTGVFTTQKTWLWCTAADVQIMRNIVKRDDDHSRAGQQRYFDWMRRRNRYNLPVSAGVDPAGWTAGLRRFVDDRYRLIASRSFNEALRLAVIRMRKTSLPVALTVSHGNHGWVLHGFTATADPLKTSDFRVTSVRVTGPLWGRQNRTFGYDMRPNTKLTPRQLRTFFTPWKYAPKSMIWDGRYVSIQPVTPRRTTTASTSTSASGAATAPTRKAAASPSPAAAGSATPTTSPATITPTPAASDDAVAVAAAPSAPPAPSEVPVSSAAPASDEPPVRAPGREVALPFLAVGSIFALTWLVIVKRRAVRELAGDGPPTPG